MYKIHVKQIKDFLIHKPSHNVSIDPSKSYGQLSRQKVCEEGSTGCLHIKYRSTGRGEEELGPARAVQGDDGGRGNYVGKIAGKKRYGEKGRGGKVGEKEKSRDEKQTSKGRLGCEADPTKDNNNAETTPNEHPNTSIEGG